MEPRSTLYGTITATANNGTDTLTEGRCVQCSQQYGTFVFQLAGDVELNPGIELASVNSTAVTREI